MQHFKVSVLLCLCAASLVIGMQRRGSSEADSVSVVLRGALSAAVPVPLSALHPDSTLTNLLDVVRREVPEDVFLLCSYKGKILGEEDPLPQELFDERSRFKLVCVARRGAPWRDVPQHPGLQSLDLSSEFERFEDPPAITPLQIDVALTADMYRRIYSKEFSKTDIRMSHLEVATTMIEAVLSEESEDSLSQNIDELIAGYSEAASRVAASVTSAASDDVIKVADCVVRTLLLRYIRFLPPYADGIPLYQEYDPTLSCIFGFFLKDGKAISEVEMNTIFGVFNEAATAEFSEQAPPGEAFLEFFETVAAAFCSLLPLPAARSNYDAALLNQLRWIIAVSEDAEEMAISLALFFLGIGQQEATDFLQKVGEGTIAQPEGSGALLRPIGQILLDLLPSLMKQKIQVLHIEVADRLAWINHGYMLVNMLADEERCTGGRLPLFSSYLDLVDQTLGLPPNLRDFVYMPSNFNARCRDMGIIR